MHIDSVRELKALVLKQHVAPLAVGERKLSALALAAKPVTEVDGTQRTLALGIMPKGKEDYHLAIRIQTRALEPVAATAAADRHFHWPLPHHRRHARLLREDAQQWHASHSLQQSRAGG